MVEPATVQARRWTRQEYDRMIDAGFFAPGERVELLEGEILRMVPQKSTHAAAIRAVEEALRSVFGAGYDIRCQLPLALDPASEPEPDVAVVPGHWRDYRDAHPSLAALVVEVSDTTLEYDRERKGSVYARAGIAEYWIVNLEDERLEVYRDPGVSLSGSAYRQVRHLNRGSSVKPLAMTEAEVVVDQLLP